jgi:hypothetical protein
MNRIHRKQLEARMNNVLNNLKKPWKEKKKRYNSSITKLKDIKNTSSTYSR